MVLNLSKGQRKELEAILEKAEPYALDDPAVNTLDKVNDFDRWNATMAKKFLEKDDQEKVQQSGE